MSDDFVHLHTHTHNSAFDGLGKPDEFCAKAAEMGQPAIALTEHGTLRGLYEASKAAASAGVKLIPGAELYLADNASLKGLSDEEKAELRARAAREGADEKELLRSAERNRRERDHVTVWAMTDEGLRNLYRLTAWSWGPGYYYKPRVDIDLLCAHSAGLAVSSGCPNGVVAKLLRSPTGAAEALARARRLAEAFGDRFVVEVMPHIPPEDGPHGHALAGKLLRLSDAFGCTLVATQDAHYPHAHDAAAQEALLCIHTRSKMDAPDRFVFDERDYWLKTRPELEAAFAAKLPLMAKAQVKKAMDGTVAFAERCTAQVAHPKAGTYLVAPPLPEGTASYDAWLMRLCADGALERFGVSARDLGAEYLGRLRHELRTIRDLGFARYFVAVWEVRAWSRSVGIMCGPGRGSGAGSLVCYLLRITDLDPLQHGLIFERFLAPGRVDLPDIDLDFESVRRQEVIDHLRDLYGEPNVAQISTHNVLGGKRAVRDLSRIFNVPEREAAAVASLVSDATEEELRHEDTLARVLRDTDVGRQFAERYPDLAAVANRLEGQLRDVGLHAAGVVMSPVPLADIVPLETRDRSKRTGDEDEIGAERKGRVTAVAYDMKGAEASGLVKLDVLGLTTLSMLRTALDLAGRHADEIDLQDAGALQGFTDGRYGGIFQYDTPSSRRLCRGYTFSRFSDVAVMTALNRPGPARSGLAREFMQRAADPSRVRSIHPVYDLATADTLGVPVYQEQVVALARGFGYTAEEADIFRKKIAKKLGLSDEEEKFVAGASAAGMDPAAAQKLFESLIGFAAYAFNKAHAYCYGALALWSMWLKVYYPAEFFAAALQFKDKPEVQMRLAAEARRCGIPVRPPDVNVPGDGFQIRRVEDGTSEIVGAVSDLKGVGEKAAQVIARAAPFAGLSDFYARTAGAGGRAVTSKTFDVLSRAGALRSVFPHSKFLAVNSREVWERLRKGWEPVPNEAIPDYEDEEAAEVIGGVWPLYVSLAGRSAFDSVLERARAFVARDLLVPGDAALGDPGPSVVIGLVASSKLFPTEDGGRVGRVTICSADGEEIALRADSDVLDTSAGALASVGRPVIAVVWTSDRGSMSLERAWPAQAVLDGSDPSAAWLVAPSRTKPRDLWAALCRAHEDQTFAASGEVLRVRRHKDKSGGKMITAGLLSETGYGRFFVFASRAGKPDLGAFAPGARVLARLRKLSDSAACLTDTPLEYLPLP